MLPSCPVGRDVTSGMRFASSEDSSIGGNSLLVTIQPILCSQH